MPVPVEPPPRTVTVKEYERKQRKKAVDAVAEDSQLKFGPEVSIQTIEVEDPETVKIPEDQRDLLSEDVVYRLAQRSPYAASSKAFCGANLLGFRAFAP